MPATGDSTIALSRAALDDLIADVNVIGFNLSSAAGRCLVRTGQGITDQWPAQPSGSSFIGSALLRI